MPAATIPVPALKPTTPAAGEEDLVAAAAELAAVPEEADAVPLAAADVVAPELPVELAPAALLSSEAFRAPQT